MSPIDTILIFAVIPAVVLLGMYAWMMLRPSRKAPRYRSGDEWPHEPVWWVGNPRATGLPEPTVDAIGTPSTNRTARGGARGTW